MNYQCFKCNVDIDEIVNMDTREDVGQFLYVCEDCADEKSTTVSFMCAVNESFAELKKMKEF